MGNISLQLLFLVVLSTFLYFDTIRLGFCHDGLNVSCIAIEKKALLEFKGSLLDPSGRLSSWRSSEDCCRWRGVSCSNKTKHVTRLDLGNPVIGVDPHSFYLRTGLALGDLSENDLSGEIPPGITSLIALDTLNLSMNQLTGNMPSDIGSLKLLESLDLSRNQLSGPIPTSMASLTLLNHLNLSQNNLSGHIPTSNQFQTFNDPSIYMGNPALCGDPLSAKCGNETPTDDKDGDLNEGNKDSDDEDELEKLKFFVVVGLGFFLGFWGICGTLIIKKRMRDAYFLFLHRMMDKICGGLRFR